MARSIASRTFVIVFFSTLVSLCASLIFSWWGLENLESTMLEAENRIEIEYFEKYGNKDTPMRVNTAQMISVYLPNGFDKSEELPVVFQNVSVPFQGEVRALGTDYIVITHAFAEGKFYIAKNLQLFEERESIFVVDVLILVAVICIIAFGLAMLASRNISGPIVRLTTRLRNLNTQATDTRMNADYADRELNEIANAMNHFLTGIEDAIKRERTLVSMASHELKTPVSVVLGAAHVIEARGKLDPNDVITLKRIIDAANEMSANIHALLNLARHSKTMTIESYRWSELFQSIQEDYQLQSPDIAKRLRFVLNAASDEMMADRVLTKMLLHNLISNALNYTQGNVVVTLSIASLTVSDEGASIADDGQSPQPWQTSGLGLYIVDLLCKQLEWRYEIIPSSEGSCVRVFFDSARRTKNEITS